MIQVSFSVTSWSNFLRNDSVAGSRTKNNNYEYCFRSSSQTAQSRSTHPSSFACRFHRLESLNVEFDQGLRIFTVYQFDKEIKFNSITWRPCSMWPSCHATSPVRYPSTTRNCTSCYCQPMVSDTNRNKCFSCHQKTMFFFCFFVYLLLFFLQFLRIPGSLWPEWAYAFVYYYLYAQTFGILLISLHRMLTVAKPFSAVTKVGGKLSRWTNINKLSSFFTILMYRQIMYSEGLGRYYRYVKHIQKLQNENCFQFLESLPRPLLHTVHLAVPLPATAVIFWAQPPVRWVIPLFVKHCGKK